jgi:hypothetical protein
MGSRIGQMASQFPQQNEQIGQSLAQGRAAQMRAAVTGTAAAGRPMARGSLAQAAAQSVQQQAQPQLQARQQNIQQQGQVAQLELQEREMTKKAELQRRQQGLAQQQRESVVSLNQLQQGLGDRLFTREVQLQKDQLGRAKFTERQLMDYKVTSAQRREQMGDYEQTVIQISQLKMQSLKQAYTLIQEALKQDFTSTEQEKDITQSNRLYAARKTIEEKIAAEQAKQAERSAMFRTVGTVVGTVGGAVVGAFAGGPAGAVAGASAGGALGGAAGSGVASATAQKKPMTGQSMNVGTQSNYSGVGPTTYGR